ncbi:MAG: hypothetical protein ACRDQ5_00110 [Sciscionella sp.]
MSDLHYSRTVHGCDGATHPRILIEDTTDTAVHAPVPVAVCLVTLLIQQTQRTLANLGQEYPTGRSSDYHLAQTADQLERVAASLREANKAFGEPG